MNKCCFTYRKGSAVAFVLIFATVLLLMGGAFVKMTSNTKMQTTRIDDRIKLEYLANGMTELALLKYQLFPSEFYDCLAASSTAYAEENRDPEPLKKFTSGDSQFHIDEKNNNINELSSSTFNINFITLHLDEMVIVTNSKWKNEVLKIKASANYRNQYVNDTSNEAYFNKTVTRIVNLNRKSKIP